MASILKLYIYNILKPSNEASKTNTFNIFNSYCNDEFLSMR